MLDIADDEGTMELVSQPLSGQLGDRLIELLSDKRYTSLTIIVAFAKSSGVLRLQEHFERFRERGGVIDVYVGIDLNGTSYEALTLLLACSDSLNIVHSSGEYTFHPKVYDFSGPSQGMIIVGSNNLTGGGLWTNFESALLVPTYAAEPDTQMLHEQIATYLQELSGNDELFRVINTQEDIDLLLKAHLVEREVTSQIRRGQMRNASKAVGDGHQLFQRGIAPRIPPLPRESSDSKQKINSIARSHVENVTVQALKGSETAWFETRKMTGGSRNILDLSMKSLVIKTYRNGVFVEPAQKEIIPGAVEFFGINPDDTNATKDITLNFNGVDYSGNTILFPVGEKANGTWRIQLKGQSDKGVKITDAFKREASAEGKVEPFLTYKVIAFSRITADHYLLSIYPESQIEEFMEASLVLAYNGQSVHSRLWGSLRND